MRMKATIEERNKQLVLKAFDALFNRRDARITYDLPSSLMAAFGSAEVNEVARGLDEKVNRILDEAWRVANQGRCG
jgi:hypothetical protein